MISKDLKIKMMVSKEITTEDEVILKLSQVKT
ncbi:hypothetical protein BN1044_04541 [Hafnia alvei]|uniref:Uncharacterized protein n=1 Tax=Hafnia alvei TaxID=569 RepID=A0A1C6Z7I2_HAFAL|nr:hypothetical protein BN1044_04541 [Hafnia alvei]